MSCSCPAFPGFSEAGHALLRSPDEAGHDPAKAGHALLRSPHEAGHDPATVGHRSRTLSN